MKSKCGFRSIEGRKCGQKVVQGFGGRSHKERDHLEDRGIDGRMGSEWILERLAGGCVDWIKLAQDRDQCQTLVNTVINL
jgi:hypothetical protein